MLFKKYKNVIATMEQSKLILFSFLCFFGVSNIFLTGYIFKHEFKTQTIVTPTNMRSPLTLNGNDFNPEYIETMGVYFAGLLGTYTPSTYTHNVDIYTSFISPKNYSDVKVSLLESTNRIIKNQLSAVFYPITVSVDKSNAIVYGESVGFVGRTVASKKMVMYEFEFENSSLGLVIKSANVKDASLLDVNGAKVKKNDPTVKSEDKLHSEFLEMQKANENIDSYLESNQATDEINGGALNTITGEVNQ